MGRVIVAECCSWEDFRLSVLKAFARNGAPSILIDWKRARRDWKRYSMTGGEAASMQLRDLGKEREYVRMMV
jgi:hypothetical protein